MMAVGVLVLSVAPGIFWLWFFYKKDKLEPEPKRLVIKLFFLGMLAVVPAYFLEIAFLGYFFFSVVLLAPVVEEGLKFAVVWFGIYKDEEFDEPMDGIVYAAAVALGFASAENPLYLFQSYRTALETQAATGSLEDWGGFWGVFAVRALLTVPGHALWSSMWGFALGRAKFMAGNTGRRIVIVGVLLSMVFHGLHNFAAVYVSPYAPIVIFMLAGVFWKVVFRNINTALEISPFASPAAGGEAVSPGETEKEERQ